MAVYSVPQKIGQVFHLCTGESGLHSHLPHGHPTIFLKFPLTSSLTHGLLTGLISKYLEYLNLSFIDFQSYFTIVRGHTLYNFNVFMLVKVCVLARIWSILVNVSYALTKNVYFSVVR